MKIQYLGHACIAIQLEKTNLLVDPFITENPLAKDKIDISGLKPDYVLLTHAHYDHTADVEHILSNQPDAIIICNYEMSNWYEAKGFKCHSMNHGGAWHFEFGKLKYVNAIHSSTFADGSYGGQPGGFIIETKKHKVYIAGDTALTLDMKLFAIGRKIDLAILPIGDNFTMGVEDALEAAKLLECDKVLGYHYDTFPPIKINKNQAQELFKTGGVELLLADIGRETTI